MKKLALLVGVIMCGGIMVVTARRGASSNQASRKLLQEAEKNSYGHVKYELMNKANPNTADNKGRSPLIWAALHENEQMVRLLIEYGADTQHKDMHGKKAIN